MSSMQTIIDTATQVGGFTTLLNALQAASLTETLRGPGPFTVFAPTDAAFKLLRMGTLNGLLKDIPKLKALLLYHIAAGTLAAKDVRAGDLKTLEGSSIAVKVRGAVVTLNTAKITKADIAATNGIIHVIDHVLIPPDAKLAAVA